MRHDRWTSGKVLSLSLDVLETTVHRVSHRPTQHEYGQDAVMVLRSNVNVDFIGPYTGG